MKNFKLTYYDPATDSLELKEVETSIPEILVDHIKQSIDTIGDDFITTPVLLASNNTDVVFGLMTNNQDRLKYKVTISLQ